MRQGIDLAELHRVAREQVQELRIDKRRPEALPPDCRVTLDDLLAASPDLDRIVLAMSGP